MPNLATASFPPPENPKEFEQMIKDLFAVRWENAQIHGRDGQEQEGIDVYGKHEGQWKGIQCKVRNKGLLTQSQIEVEINKAHRFRHKLHTFIIVTTQPRDKHLQAIIDELDQQEQNAGGFTIQIRFWDDVCSLLAENIHIARKYYSDFFHEWQTQKIKRHFPLLNQPTVISPGSPLLVGILIDVSASMRHAIQPSTHLSKHDLMRAINLIIEKIIGFCENPAGEILPQCILFAYGYGFGQAARGVIEIFQQLGFKVRESLPASVSDAPIRDLFAHAASQHAIPYSPDALTLYKYSKLYQKSVQAQIFDAGLGPSLLKEAMQQIFDRFCKELERPVYKHPLLFLISDGKVPYEEGIRAMAISDQIKQLGIEVVSCYVESTNITQPKEFYGEHEQNWPLEAQLLFQLSSRFSTSNQLLFNAKTQLLNKGWIVPENAHLFIQMNHSEMLDELLDVLLSSLQEPEDRKFS